MGVKQPHKTRRNGDKRHEDGLNNNRDMTHSSKHETTIFEIQTRDIYVPTPHEMLQRHRVQVQNQNYCIFRESSFNMTRGGG